MRSINLLNVEGHTTLKRDVSSNAILNTDDSDYEAYKIRRQQQIKQKKDIDSLQQEVNGLKNDLLEIKELLSMLVKGKQ